MSTAILAATTLSCMAFDVPHNGAFKTKYSSITGKDSYYGLQASDGEYTSSSSNGLTMFYLYDNVSGDQVRGSVDRSQLKKHIYQNRGIQASSHTHTATDHLQ